MADNIDYAHPRIAAAIAFVQGEIELALQHCYPGTHLYSSWQPRPWIHYAPAMDDRDRLERAALITKYGAATPDQLEYYLYLHGCYEFAVFYWTVLSVAGKDPRIVVQSAPFPHCYLVIGDQAVDPLMDYSDINYPNDLSQSTRYATPHDLYAGVFIPPVDRRDWEEAQLLQLKQLE